MVFWALLLACSAQNRGEWWIDREDNVRALWLFGSFFYVLFGDEHPVSYLYAGKRGFSLGNRIVMQLASSAAYFQSKTVKGKFFLMDIANINIIIVNFEF